MLASFTVVVVGTSLSVAMVRGGMVTGFRAIFVSFLSVLQAARSAQGCGLWCMRLQPLVQGCDLHYMHIPHALHPPLRPAQLNLVLNAVVTVELYLLWLYLPWQMNLVLNAIVTFELPAQLTLIVNAGELGVYLPWPYSLLTTHHSPLTTHHPTLDSLLTLLTARYSLLTTHYSLLTTHYSLLTAHYSLLTTHCSLLTTHYLRPGCYVALLLTLLVGLRRDDGAGWL